MLGVDTEEHGVFFLTLNPQIGFIKEKGNDFVTLFFYIITL